MFLKFSIVDQICDEIISQVSVECDLDMNDETRQCKVRLSYNFKLDYFHD